MKRKDKRRMFLLKASKAATETDMTQFMEAAAKAKDPAEFWRAKFWDTACLAVTKVVQEERR